MNVVTQFPAARDYERDLRFQAMFEGAAIGIAICQLDGRMVEANPALSRMLGYSQQELAAMHAGELYPELLHGSIRNFAATLAAKFIPIIFRPTNGGWAS
jgi:PAS domain S-box-containing protein